MEEPVSIVDIYPTGDAILVCGGELDGGKSIKFRVSSAAMAMGSTTMRTLFKPHFKEGTDLRLAEGDTPLEIVLPKDDPFAIEVICNVLHLQYHKVDTSDSFTTHNVLRVAEMSDKYGCDTAMMYPARDWLSRNAPSEDDHILFLAAFLFRNSNAFQEYGRKLILRSVTGPTGDGSGDGKAHLEAMHEAIKQKREHMRSEVHVLLERVIDARSTLRQDLGNAYACMPGCGIAEVCFANFMQALKQSNLYPWSAITSRSVNESLENAKNLRHSIPDHAYACANKDCVGRSPRLGNGPLPYIAQEVAKLAQNLIGPCLKCFLDESKVELAGCIHLPPKERPSPAKVYDAADVIVARAPQPPTAPQPMLVSQPQPPPQHAQPTQPPPGAGSRQIPQATAASGLYGPMSAPAERGGRRTSLQPHQLCADSAPCANPATTRPQSAYDYLDPRYRTAPPPGETIAVKGRGGRLQ